MGVPSLQKEGGKGGLEALDSVKEPKRKQEKKRF